jgi:hypothetical protein
MGNSGNLILHSLIAFKKEDPLFEIIMAEIITENMDRETVSPHSPFELSQKNINF